MGRKRFVSFLLLALGMVFYARAVTLCQRAEPQMGLTYVYLRQSVGSAAVARMGEQEAQEEAPVRFCFWGQGGETTLSCGTTFASCSVNQILLAGNPALLGAGSLTMQRGVLLDEDTAQTLFRSPSCGGQTVQRNGADCPVLGTVDAFQPCLVRLAEKEDGKALSWCVLELPAEKSRLLGEAFLLRHGLSGTVLDYYPFWALTKNGLLLFPLVLLLGLCHMVRGKKRFLSFSGIRSGAQLAILGRTLLSLCLLLAGLWLLGKRLVIPRDMIPSRWSDFSFWGSWWESQKQNLFAIVSSSPSTEQLQMVGNMIKSIGNATAAFLLAAMAVRRRNHADTAD